MFNLYGTDFESTQENADSEKSCFYSENISIRTECIITLIPGNCEGNFNFAGKQAKISLWSFQLILKPANDQFSLFLLLFYSITAPVWRRQVSI